MIWDIENMIDSTNGGLEKMKEFKSNIPKYKLSNMENNTTVPTKLFDKILKCIDDKCEGQRGGDISGRYDASLAIERLVIQEKIDLLEYIRVNKHYDYDDEILIENKTVELTNQLNNI